MSPLSVLKVEDVQRISRHIFRFMQLKLYVVLCFVMYISPTPGLLILFTALSTELVLQLLRYRLDVNTLICSDFNLP